MNRFEFLCEETIQDFVREYGENKYRQIHDKLINSSSLKKNYHIIENTNRPPNSSELIVIVQNIKFFTFSSKKYTAIAATLLLMAWNELNNKNQEICDDTKLINIINSVFEKAYGLLW